jgi:hypothetical protein
MKRRFIAPALFSAIAAVSMSSYAAGPSPRLTEDSAVSSQTDPTGEIFRTPIVTMDMGPQTCGGKALSASQLMTGHYACVNDDLRQIDSVDVYGYDVSLTRSNEGRQSVLWQSAQVRPFGIPAEFVSQNVSS